MLTTKINTATGATAELKFDKETLGQMVLVSKAAERCRQEDDPRRLIL